EKHYPPHIKFPNPAENYHAKRLNEQRREFIENISTRNPFFTITEAATIRAAWTIIRREPGVSAEELNRQLAELSGASLDAVHKRLERIRSKGQIPMIREALDYALPKFRKMEVSKLKSRRPACVRCEKSPMVIWSCSRCSIDPARISKPISYSSGLCSKHEAEPEKYHREFCPACGWPRGMQYVTGCPICTPGAGFNPGELSKILKKNEKSCRV
ncbi:MAG: hypothetical protein QUT30_16175, partial [Acidobacteriota bacterium]|nr:hypothetical protein [Acidobacteriota bacterium]